MTENNDTIVDLVAGIVSAFVAHNSVPTSELPALIASTHAALANLGKEPDPVIEDKPVPAVTIKKSITPDYIICLEDGLKFKSLKRHLRTKFDMSPEQYKAKWNLPADYPMVAPTYAEQRSKLAKTMGLGQQRRKTPRKRTAKTAA